MKTKMKLFSMIILICINSIGCIVTESTRGLWAKKEKDNSLLDFASGFITGRGSSQSSVTTNAGTVATYTIGGTVTGLTAAGLVLQNNAGDDLTVASGATTFTFSTAIASGAYAVTVKTQPTGLTCTVSTGTGTASANVNNIGVACLPTVATALATYTIGGTITGLTASGLVLQNNAGNDLTVASGAASFTFSTAVASGTAYAITVKTQPTGLICTVTSGTGSATANVTSVSLTCDSIGSSWTARTLPSSQSWNSVTYGNGVFVAVTPSSTVAATSPDGITWTARTLPSSQSWNAVTYGNGVFVAVGGGSTVAASSPNAVNLRSPAINYI
ncbi:MAG TPA: hypothetical protein PLG41_23120, partial [Leptospiraceae bacterium]|nr:hypothetical protein [Leptospiraceae bacterium]